MQTALVICSTLVSLTRR